MRQGRPSETARRVAAYRLGFARAEGFGDAAADDRLQADVADGLRVEDSRFSRYLAARTRFFDGAVVGSPLPQVVVVGAGYDGRSLRFARTGVRWLEVDHPTTLADRERRLAALGIVPAATTVPVDLERDDLPAALRRAGHDVREPTLLMVEGVTAYLSAAALSELLRACRCVAAPGSVLAVDLVLVPQTDADTQARAALQRRVAAVGEPFGAALHPADVTSVLERHGWGITTAVDPAGRSLDSSTARTVFVTAEPA